ncbi:MAG: hypothetical protein KA780_02330 [Prolixibacteraceae bacterium]|jgi:hypothetical protein|nr:hypothetical protein [Prolixibacteraceae bacterium]NLX29179.1 hypothetical protein [Bacteroidales bacterium]HPJ78605.1 hypothetical protein [Prolixibacteraceae bacterium]HRV88974.1 hypothetical protein [Prolixibacteraceae bacterium]
MPDIQELKIPYDILKQFQGSVRIVEKLRWRGIWPIDPLMRKRIEEQLPQIRSSATISKNYEWALVYKGRTLEEDLKRLGITEINPVIIKKWLIGIPVPWRLLQNMKIDYKKFDVVLTPKM